MNKYKFPLSALAILVTLYVALGFAFGWEPGIDLSSTIAATIAALAIAFFAWQQMENTKRQNEIEDTKNLISLRNTSWTLIELCSSEWENDPLTSAQELKWYTTVKSLFDSQAMNPCLLSDTDSMQYWHNSISCLQNPTIIPFNVNVRSRRDDVLEVWQRLILKSGKHLTGGRPYANK